MPNQKQRKKKDGENKSKKLQRMREAEGAKDHPPGRNRAKSETDEVDKMKFKRGAANDRTRTGAP